jgi:hypothetical protein
MSEVQLHNCCENHKIPLKLDGILRKGRHFCIIKPEYAKRFFPYFKQKKSIETWINEPELHLEYPEWRLTSTGILENYELGCIEWAGIITAPVLFYLDIRKSLFMLPQSQLLEIANTFFRRAKEGEIPTEKYGRVPNEVFIQKFIQNSQIWLGLNGLNENTRT